ncbi:ammonium transporter [Moniliophthora roreri]|nr:ammonium transporter [Moniliophthora roreri]
MQTAFPAATTHIKDTGQVQGKKSIETLKIGNIVRWTICGVLTPGVPSPGT